MSALLAAFGDLINWVFDASPLVAALAIAMALAFTAMLLYPRARHRVRWARVAWHDDTRPPGGGSPVAEYFAELAAEHRSVPAGPRRVA